MIKNDEIAPIGRVTKTHGINGELAIAFDAEIDFDACDYFVFEMDGIFVPFFIDEMRFKSETTAFVLFDGVKNETQAREFCGKNVYAKRELVSESQSFTFTGLLGCSVECDGKIIGTIDDFDLGTENVLIRVGEKLIPFCDEFIVDLDAEKRILHMNLPEGLLEI